MSAVNLQRCLVSAFDYLGGNDGAVADVRPILQLSGGQLESLTRVTMRVGPR